MAAVIQLPYKFFSCYDYAVAVDFPLFIACIHFSSL